MSNTKYQVGTIIFNNGETVNFICKPLENIFSEEEMKEMKVKNIQFFPVEDMTEQVQKNMDKVKDSIMDKPGYEWDDFGADNTNNNDKPVF